MRNLLPTALALSLLLMGCSGSDSHEIDEPAWRSDVETSLGHDVIDWSDYMSVWTGMCKDEKDVDDWAMTISVFTDRGTSVSDIEMNVEHACPGQLEDVRDAAEQVQSTGRKFDELCRTDPDLLTESESRMVEAAGC